MMRFLPRDLNIESPVIFGGCILSIPSGVR